MIHTTMTDEVPSTQEMYRTSIGVGENATYIHELMRRY